MIFLSQKNLNLFTYLQLEVVLNGRQNWDLFWSCWLGNTSSDPFGQKKQNKHVIRKSYIYISTQRYSPSTCAVEKRGEKLPRARGHHENNEWWDSSDDIKIKTNKKNAFKSASTVEIQITKFCINILIYKNIGMFNIVILKNNQTYKF